jgi:hypothetical protein
MKVQAEVSHGAYTDGFGFQTMMNTWRDNLYHNDRVKRSRFVRENEGPINLDAKEFFGDFQNIDPFMNMKDGYEN